MFSAYRIHQGNGLLDQMVLTNTPSHTLTPVRLAKLRFEQVIERDPRNVYPNRMSIEYIQKIQRTLSNQDFNATNTQSPRFRRCSIQLIKSTDLHRC